MAENIDNSLKILNGVFWTFIGQFTSLVRFISTLILAKILSPSDFGVVSIAVSIVSIAQLMRDWGWHQGIIQKKCLNEKNLNSIFWIIVLISVCISLILIIFSNCISKFYSNEKLHFIIIWLTLDFFIRSFFQVPDALLRRKMNFRVFVLADLTGGIVGGLLGISFALLGLGVYSLAIRIILNSLVIFLYLWCASNWRPKLIFCRKSLQSFTSFGVPIFFIGMLGLARSQAEPIMIGKWLSTSDLGIYSMAYSIVTISTVQWTQAISRVAYSSLSKLQNNLDLFNNVFLRFNMIVLFFVVPVAVFISHESNNLVVIMLGNKWINVNLLLSILIWSGVGLSIFTVSTVALRSLGRTKIEFWLNFVLNTGVIFSIAVGVYFKSLYILSICMTLWVMLVAFCVSFYMMSFLHISISSYIYINKSVILSFLFCLFVINGFNNLLMGENHNVSEWINVIISLIVIVLSYISVFAVLEWKLILKFYYFVTNRVK